MEKILITGGNGYLGACIHNEFSKTYKADKLQGRLEQIEPNSMDYDLVIHSAAALRHGIGDHQKANVEGTKQLLRGLKKKTRIVYISSGSIYGKGNQGVYTEQSTANPKDDYAKTKYKGELAILESKNPFIIIRPSTLFGPGYNNLGPTFPSIVLQELYHGNDINLFSPDVMQQYLYVWDLVSIIKRLISNPKSWNGTFNASGKKRSLHQLIFSIETYLKQHNQSRGKIHETYKKPIPGFFLDNTFLEKIIGRINFTPDSIVIEKLGRYLGLERSNNI